MAKPQNYAAPTATDAETTAPIYFIHQNKKKLFFTKNQSEKMMILLKFS
ncbi:hypothetical protein [Gilliamella sp. Imp1-1]|nr:hypothetical protein [Gilliamella apicola]KDN11365.1 hypothetical protein GAPWKB30_0065 [Gilliamella apicola]